MRSKWYFGALLIALTFFVASQQQITVPNQEIVFQFSDNQTAVSQTEATIAVIKSQLKSIGVKNTQVLQYNGTLTISYYSDTSIENVKAVLLKEKLVKLVGQDIQSDNPLNDDYQIDVFEIKTTTESGIGFDGKYIVEVKQEYTRASQVTVSFLAIAENILQLNQTIIVAKKVNTNISISIDKGAFNIPEGRAGPVA
ncbi:hypothetical protein [Psychroserpens sp. NJDZ02]|uniref:hypothetical protein n=1 Tax=Psychroserpens sp. NJDZ02 TaxID=2570561 RepID=UPI0010A927D7|nr:hypothetical protein [Psychroserpens sp. NJDZ02]QCE41970.1 hypothetical protein E9099_11275 [Psychroserpens sp. NJDZ02]